MKLLIGPIDEGEDREIGGGGKWEDGMYLQRVVFSSDIYADDYTQL